MKFLIWACVTQVVWYESLALYHMQSRKDFLPPRKLRNDSYFGYSITFDSQHQELVISSPRENNIGEVYRCDINQKQKCTPFIKPQDLTDRVSTKYTHDYWFGATVKAGPDFVLMCAPRFTELFFSFREYGTYGKCYSTKNVNVTQLQSIDEKERLSDTPLSFEATMDSFGWSIDVASDDSIAVGGPGMSTGRVMIYPQGRSDPNFIRKLYRPSKYNFGYSVAFGTFITDSLSYAVGSTYGVYGSGQVTFYEGVELQVELRKGFVDVDVGSMFGAVLCAAKMSGSHSDLIVGAPTYGKENTYNLGAVHIYIFKSDGEPPKYLKTIKGRQDGSLFGSAIVSLGDLNGDNKEEVAISAPYENSGSVYLYSGADLVNDMIDHKLNYLQKFEPEPHSVFETSFGWSLTPLLDYDQNGCNELAIGAPFSDAVAVYSCMASVTVKLETIFPNLQTRTQANKTDFVFQVCLLVEYPTLPKDIIADLSTTVEMIHNSAKLTKAVKGVYIFNTSLHDRQQTHCTDVDLYLPLDGQYEEMIWYQISSIQINNPMAQTTFNSSRVILSDLSVLNLTDSVWAAECSGSNVCLPNLKLDIVSSLKDKYHLGSSQTENISLNVTNSGDVAYEPCIRVHITGAMVGEKSNDCVFAPSTDGDRLICMPRKPLKTNKNWDVDNISLKMTELTNLDRNVTVNISVFNSCKDVNQSLTENRVTYLISDPKGVTVDGNTNIGDYVMVTNDDIQNSGKHMEHVYTIINVGLGHWAGLRARITLQKKPYISYNEKAVSVYVDYEGIISHSFCQLSKDTPMEYICKIESLRAKGHIVKIIVPIYVVPGKLEGLLADDKNVTTSTKLTLLLEGDEITNITQSIVTTIHLRGAFVPRWVIVVSVLFGFVILIIIGFILYECGFLRRKNKEELKQLQLSVKRQTIRRSMMQTPAHTEDRTEVLECMNEENEDVEENENHFRKRTNTLSQK